MEWEPQQQDLGGLGFAGICAEIKRVIPRAFLPHHAIIVSAFLLAHIATFHALLSLLVGDDGDVTRRVASWAAFIALETASMLVVFLFSLVCTAAYIFRVGSLYCTDGDVADDDTDEIVRDIPPASVNRLLSLCKRVLPLATSYILLSGLALLLLLHLHGSRDREELLVVLPLQVLGGAACLASAAYVAVVSHIACVVAMLEDAAAHFSAVSKSRALLSGKLWAAAAVLVPLDVCSVALQASFMELVLDDAMGLGGSWFQVAVFAAIAVALWAVMVVTLVAQPVVYLVCKNHHHEVVDKVHLNYIGEYQQLAVDGDSGALELQPVETAPKAATAQCPGQSPAVSSSTT